MSKTLLPLPLAGALLASAFALLAGCTNLPRNPDVDAAQSGVTVYGTVDAGVSHTGK
ncbi:MAG: hypothetical protein J0I00_05455 [Burkholderiales bacterium]|uniref:Uncharacterized protein n=1 Tax=Ottowia pentelensis TaxID=511108 RepID=A0ABV6PVZ4_9BURK|nr:hypothetical protein [Burkholderiales bacterium]MBS0416058.1 hypothetical protein [Pseudomonadota bacterium]